MSERTISDHLSYCVRNGDLGLDTLVPPVKETLIRKYFLNAESKHLAPAKEVMGDDISYEELKYVLKHMEYLGEI